MATAQSLEWLQLLGEAALRERTASLLDNSIAARAGQATREGFREFTRGLEKKLK